MNLAPFSPLCISFEAASLPNEFQNWCCVETECAVSPFPYCVDFSIDLTTVGSVSSRQTPRHVEVQATSTSTPTNFNAHSSDEKDNNAATNSLPRRRNGRFARHAHRDRGVRDRNQPRCASRKRDDNRIELEQIRGRSKRLQPWSEKLTTFVIRKKIDSTPVGVISRALSHDH